MTPAQRHRRALQERILDDVKAASGATDAEVAGWASVDRSEISRWRNGERPITAVELLGIVRGLGDAVPVLRPLAEAGDCDVVHRSGEATGDVVGRALGAMAGSGALVRELAEALADGRVDDPERAKLLEAIRKHRIAVEQLETELRAPRSGR